MKTPVKILIIEDEIHIAEGLAFNLKKLGFDPEIATNGILALEKWESFRPDLIVLDIMLPKIDGHQILKTVRKTDQKIPILILSAKGQPVDRIRGLSIGGDDYLTKPFELEEFLLRVQRLLQRSLWSKSAEAPSKEGEGQSDSPPLKDLPPSNFSFGSNLINFTTNEAVTAQGTIPLTDLEIKLLKIFVLNKGKILSRKNLLQMGWGYNDNIATRTIDNFIVRFRKYFEEDSKNPRFFKSQRGRGYLFDPHEETLP